MKFYQLTFSFFILLMVANHIQAQGGYVEPPTPCSSPEYRQMDFWIGEWEVFTSRNNKVGKSRIEQALGSCVLMEYWEPNAGGRSQSFNVYNSQNHRWEQTTVDNGGNVFYFHGNWNESEGQMILSGESVIEENEVWLNRLSYTPQKDGSVHHLWEVSRDSGKNYLPFWECTYRKKK